MQKVREVLKNNWSTTQKNGVAFINVKKKIYAVFRWKTDSIIFAKKSSPFLAFNINSWIIFLIWNFLKLFGSARYSSYGYVHTRYRVTWRQIIRHNWVWSWLASTRVSRVGVRCQPLFCVVVVGGYNGQVLLDSRIHVHHRNSVVALNVGKEVCARLLIYAACRFVVDAAETPKTDCFLFLTYSLDKNSVSIASEAALKVRFFSK